jgi:hypothetical protein
MSSSATAIGYNSPSIQPGKIEATLSAQFKFTIVFTLLHLPLGILFYQLGAAGAIHPLAAFSLGVYWALQRTVPLERIALVCIYIIASEVLWRMADLPVLWEFGKYGVSTIAVVALARRRLYRFPPVAMAFILLLIPSCIITIAEYPEYARIMLSFNMSGPLALSICCWYFYHTKFRQPQIRKLFIVALAPLISVAVVTLFFTVSNPEIEFNLESNDATSGGFGPNQVSSMLGLGAFIAVSSLLLFKQTTKEKVFLCAAALFLSAQSVMTFSRGGMYNAVGALIVVLFFLIGDFKTFFKRTLPPVAVAILFLVVVFPYLNQYTGGMLEARFESTEGTNRMEIVESDFQILSENPVFGVGVGVANWYRTKYLDYAAASHTEFSRLIAEHGLFGLAAIGCLVILTVSSLKRSQPGFSRALKAGVIVWCFLFMLNAGMRLAAPSLLFALGLTGMVSVRPNYRRFSRRNRASRYVRRLNPDGVSDRDQ